MKWMEITLAEVEKLPLWSRSTAISNDGTIFVSGGLAGDEEMVSLCALDDGVSAVSHLGHLFFPAEWLSRTFPQSKQICEIIELMARKFTDS